MNIVRIYCDIKDIRIKGLVNHFMRCLGVYVIEIYEGKETDDTIDSMCDIYVISEFYNRNSIDIENEKKSIVILSDGYDIGENEFQIKKIKFDDETEDEFLNQLLYEMQDILNTQKLLEKRLVYSDDDYCYNIKKIIKEYVKNKIFDCSLYMRYYFADERLFEWSIQKYRNFIGELEEWNREKHSDLLNYTISYIMYEADVMCKRNSYKLLYSTEQILDSCSELLQKYDSNEEIRLLSADVYFELLEFGTKAANEYGSIFLNHCAYAHYKRGRAFRKFVGDIDSAKISIKNALKLNKFYYNAWYQYAMCLAYEEDYEGEAITLFNIFKALKSKWNENILSPLEFEYLYKALLLIEQLSDQKKYKLLSDEEYEKTEKQLMNKWRKNKYEEQMQLIKNKELGGEKEKGIERLRNFREQMCV